jgi:nicotinamidase-related amidase
MERRALLVIDVQNDYFPGGAWALPGAERALPNILRLIEGAREREEPVVFIRHVAPEGSPVFARGSRGGALHEGLGARPADPAFEKAHPSAFQDTGLADWLDEAGIGALDLCGFMTQMCCDTTAREAYARGFKVRLFSDACAARDLVVEGETIPHQVVHGTHLATLARFAKILTSAQAD